MATDFSASNNHPYEIEIEGEVYGKKGRELEEVAYGKPEYFRQQRNNESIDIPIFPIDDLDDDDARGNCETYNVANELLADASNCICIGLSEAGITQSHLEFGSLENVFYSGSQIETAGYDNFVPLNKKADAIVTELGES